MADDDTITLGADSAQKPPAPGVCEAGKQLGPIRLIRQIGKGGMGEVWLARHELLGRDVAVKVLPTAVMDRNDPAFREFMDGAKAAASLEHPSLNKVLHADVADGLPYLVMELLDGPNLKDIVERTGRMDPSAVRTVIEAVGEAVAELHHHDLVHRDLKPSNIMLTSDGRIVVTDFGLACSRPVSALRGKIGLMAGSPVYMAPEMFDGVVSARTDVYAIGMTAYELLCGQPPYVGKLDDLRQQHKSVELDVGPLRAAGVPDGVIDAIVRSTSKNVLYRPKTARHVLDSFRMAFDDAGVRPASRESLARLLIHRARGGTDQTRTGGTPAATLREAISQMAAKKRDQRDSDHPAGAAPAGAGGTPSTSAPKPIDIPVARRAEVAPLTLPPGVAQLAYSHPPRHGRPGVLTAIGVISIVIASLALLFNLQMEFQAVVFFGLSRVAAAQPATAVPASPAMVSGPGPSAGPATATATASLTPAEVQQVIAKIQGNVMGKLSPGQISTLQKMLQSPSQQLVTPGTAWSPVRATNMQSNGTANINLSGGFIQLDKNGVVVSQFSNGNPLAAMHFSSWACLLCAGDGLVSFGLAVMLLIAGIAIFRRSRRSLRMHQIYAWVKLPLAVVGGFAYGRVLTDFVGGVPGLGAAKGGLFGIYGTFFTLASIAYPIALLIALRSKKVRRYYQSIAVLQSIHAQAHPQAD